MRKFLFLIQIALFSLTIAEETVTENKFDGWWFRVIPERRPAEAASTTCLLQSQPLVKRDDYTYTSGIGGYKVHTNAATWPQARRTCEQEGGHLAVINSVAEANAITNLWENSGTVYGNTGSSDYALIGFHDLFEEGEHLTIHTESLAKAGFTQWAAGQPDNLNGVEHCGSLHKNGGLNDISCTNKYAFICELPIY